VQIGWSRSQPTAFDSPLTPSVLSAGPFGADLARERNGRVPGQVTESQATVTLRDRQPQPWPSLCEREEIYAALKNVVRVSSVPADVVLDLAGPIRLRA
jgi:hypothetical protein